MAVLFPIQIAGMKAKKIAVVQHATWALTSLQGNLPRPILTST
jgi:hypothetical protein